MSAITAQEAAQWLMARDRFLILTHIRPDGDTIGCAAGLCAALREQGKTAYVLENPDLNDIYAPYVGDYLAPEDFAPDFVVSVDIAAIDHHPSQEFFAAQTCLDEKRAACGEIIYDIIRRWGPVSQAAALPLYVAIATDCGCFVYSNTDAACHRTAAALLDTGIDVFPINRKHFRTKTLKRLQLEGMLTAEMEVHDGGETAIVALTLDMLKKTGAKQEDVDDISAFVGQIAGVKTGVTIREMTGGRCKLSVRTAPGDLDAGKVCALLGGGGHAAAAGAAVEGDVAAAKAAVLNAIAQVRHG